MRKRRTAQDEYAKVSRCIQQTERYLRLVGEYFEAVGLGDEMWAGILRHLAQINDPRYVYPEWMQEIGPFCEYFFKPTPDSRHCLIRWTVTPYDRRDATVRNNTGKPVEAVTWISDFVEEADYRIVWDNVLHWHRDVSKRMAKEIHIPP